MRLIPVLLFFIASLDANAQKTIPCSCKGFIDTNYKGSLLLKDAPKGKVIQPIPYQHKKGDYLLFDITQTADSFFFIKMKYTVSGIAYQGWIKKGKYLATYLKKDSTTLPLFYEASYTAKVKNKVPGKGVNYFEIFNCTQNWLYIRELKKNSKLQGWIHSQTQCPVPSASCR
ncbi:MAG: hypothetical protein JST02_06255 [Bacteroidetes bacterium]|nr:hypothetical protein [Bacteroidota bacterium]